MGPFIWGGVIVLGVLGGILTHRANRRRWREAARTLRLTNVNAWSDVYRGTSGVAGKRDGFAVHLWDCQPEGWKIAHLTVDGRHRIPLEIDLRRQGTLTPEEKRRGLERIEVGEETFDATVFAHGPEVLLIALLDAETRSLVLDFVTRGGRVVDGTMEIPLASPLAERAGLVQLFDGVLALAVRLVRPTDILARIIERAREDPVPGVRVRAVGILAGRPTEHASVRAVLREALTHDDEELRLRAAVALGKEGRETLLEVASHTEGDNSQAVRAIEALGRHLPLDRAIGLLNDALRTGHHNVARATIEALGRIGGEAAVARLAAVLLVGDATLAVAAARALASTESTAAERPLIQALSHAQPDVQIAASDALGTLGTIAAVPPLRLVLEAAGADHDLRRAAQQAIAAIQSRIPGASPGQVSLAEGEAGQVSLAADDASGRVSLSPTHARGRARE